MADRKRGVVTFDQDRLLASVSRAGRDRMPGSQLRPLPGYTSHVGHMGTTSGQAIGSIGATTSIGVTSDGSHPASDLRATPYQTRERLYYQPDFATARPAAEPSSLCKNPSLSADAPPADSLYDYALTPERRHLQAKPPGPSSSCPYGSGGSGGPDGPDGPSDNEDPMDLWVTVFGFAGIHSAAILHTFKAIGPIDQYELGQGNWIHLHYTSRWAAQKALLRNGSILPVAGSCMVGVLPTSLAMSRVSAASDSVLSPLKPGPSRCPSLSTTPAAVPRYSAGSIFKKPISKHPSTPAMPHHQSLMDYDRHTPSATHSLNPVEPAKPTDPAGPDTIVNRLVSFIFGW